MIYFQLFLFKKQPLYKHMREDISGIIKSNKWVISSYEIYNSESEPPSLLMAQLQGVGLRTPKLTEPNPTTNALKKQ
ncbi:hypothetical protein I6661_01555 [Helicobacter pylori]|nr:hypothetical protein [Helicobacter pylori]